MNIYFAPMEGITGAIYRRTARKHFPDVDRYYAPFVQPNQKRVFVPKEQRDILPENNDNVPLVPQVLTCVADGFIRAGKALEAYGYREVNLNLGCPSGTVVSKGKGAGMLSDVNHLDAFLEEVFSQDWKAKISVKTRLGVTENMDFEELLNVFHKYPICELIIHPRYRTDFYKGTPRFHEFERAVHMYEESNPFETRLCYNGNIFTKKNYEQLLIRYGEEGIDSVMIGRGLLANPALVREIRGGSPLSKDELLDFHDDLFEVYSGLNFGEKNTLFKMKELWNYWGPIFADADRELKRVRKADRYSDYLPAVKDLFRSADFTQEHGFVPGQ